MKRRLPILWVALSMALGLGAPRVAQAAAPAVGDLSSNQRAQLGQAIAKARDAFQAHHYDDAIASLERAYRIFPEPNILYRIGQSYERQDKLAEAIVYYRRYIDAAPDASDAPMVRDHIGDLSSQLHGAHATHPPQTSPPDRKLAVLLIDSNPAGASVRAGSYRPDKHDESGVQEKVRGQTPVRLNITPGEVAIHLSAPGYRTIDRVLRIEPGETISIVYPLEALPKKSDSSSWPWIIGGVGVASLATSAGLFVAAYSASSQIEDYDTARLDAYRTGSAPAFRPGDYDDLVRQRYYMSRSGWITAGVGVVALGAGVGLLLYSGGDEQGDITLVPGPQGAAVQGSF